MSGFSNNIFEKYEWCFSFQFLMHTQYKIQGHRFNVKTVFPVMEIPVIKMRRSQHTLSFIMGILMSVTG